MRILMNRIKQKIPCSNNTRKTPTSPVPELEDKTLSLVIAEEDIVAPHPKRSVVKSLKFIATARITSYAYSARLMFAKLILSEI